MRLAPAGAVASVPVDAHRLLGVPAEELGRVDDLAARLGERLAVLAHDQLGERVGAREHAARRRARRIVAALARRLRRPARLRRVRGVDARPGRPSTVASATLASSGPSAAHGGRNGFQLRAGVSSASPGEPRNRRATSARSRVSHPTSPSTSTTTSSRPGAWDTPGSYLHRRPSRSPKLAIPAQLRRLLSRNSSTPSPASRRRRRGPAGPAGSTRRSWLWLIICFALNVWLALPRPHGRASKPSACCAVPAAGAGRRSSSSCAS